MSGKPFHLAFFTAFGPNAWNDPLAVDESPWTGELHIDLAKALERACFDYMLIEDTLSIPDNYGGSRAAYLKHGLMAPKHDPAPLAAILGASTSRLGIVSTLSTLAYPPFMLARLCATLDHFSRGRFGWNIVTGTEDAAARNLGLPGLPPRALRYDMADEYVDLVNKLFASWEPDAVVLDRETGTYADASKVHNVNFEGKWFRCEGPLNTVPSPQGRCAYIQAGGSARGRQFAATHADSVIATVNGPAGMKRYRDDVRAHAAAQGRNPDDIKILFLVAPVIGATMEEARDLYERTVASQGFIERTLTLFSSFIDIDFSKYDLDQPLPPLTTNAEQGALDKFCQPGSGKTLRQLVREGGFSSSLELVGTPGHVADVMAAAMEEAGGDGFLITTPHHRLNRRYIATITEGLVPALQRRGLTRTAYAKTTLRENLLEF